jgi:prepilin-type N-terminal cleavage/methylation domain-containing protein
MQLKRFFHSKTRKLSKETQAGFTLIEILMVLILIAILAMAAITQFTNNSIDARNNTTKANLQLLRRAIGNMNGMQRLRCNVSKIAWPNVNALNENDITANMSYCDKEHMLAVGKNVNIDFSSIEDRKFIKGGIPINPWGPGASSSANNGARKVHLCASDGCSNRAMNCGGTALRSVTDDGWCYDENNGEIWANTDRNDGKDANTGNEYAY